MAKEKGSKKLYIIIAMVFLVTIAFTWLRGISVGYADSFIFHGDSVDEAVSYMDSLSYTSAEAEKLQPLQVAWDDTFDSNLWEKVSVATSDHLQLSGYYLNQKSQQTVIVFLRFNETKDSDFLYGTYFVEQGYNVLLTDMRAHGESQGETTSFGYTEQQDVLAWTRYVGENIGGTVLIYGEGMGANAALLAASNGKLSAISNVNVAGIIAESPYSSLKKEASYMLKEAYRLPAFPFYNLIEWVGIRRGINYTSEDTEYSNQLASADIPVLFLLAEQDNYVNPEYTKEIYEAYPGPKQLLTANCRHGLIYAQSRTEIETTIATMMGSSGK